MLIEIKEAGLREGLQSNNKLLTAVEKTSIVEKLIDVGIKRIELGFQQPNPIRQGSGLPHAQELYQHGLPGLLGKLDLRLPKGNNEEPKLLTYSSHNKRMINS